MDWVKDFYSKQSKLYKGCYLGGVTEAHRNKVKIIEQLADSGEKCILELGAGGGQKTVAAAELGHKMTAIELVDFQAEHIRKLAKETGCEITIIEVDFYKVELKDKFDIVCYWDGFGIGTDEDQRHLLKRIANWLRPDGCALIDVYTPWWGIDSIGKEHMFYDARSRYDFDFEGSRMINTWWHMDKIEDTITQSLRCYSPADLKLLLEGTGLALEMYESAGGFDPETKEYQEKVSLENAIWYVAKLIKCK